MNKVTKILAGLLLLAAALIGVYAFMLAQQPKPLPAAVALPAAAPADVNRYSVVVAIQPLAAGKPIPLDAVKVENLPLQPANSFTDATSVVGKLPVVDVGVGVPLLQSHLSGGLADQIAAGERAVAVNIDEAVAVGYRIKPGDFVDVFFTLKQDSAEIAPTQARLLLPRLRVLATGQVSVNEDASRADPNRALARTAVLAVPVADVNRLTLAQQSGRLTLALRNPKDDELPSASLFAQPAAVLQPRDYRSGTVDVASGQVLSGKLLQQPVNQAFAGTSLPGLSARKDGVTLRAGPPGPVRLAPMGETVEIIRGGVHQ